MLQFHSLQSEDFQALLLYVIVHLGFVAAWTKHDIIS